MEKKAKILLIDDDFGLLTLLQLGLEREGFTVLTAKSGKEGVRKAYENRPDAMVLDVMMAEMDGWTTCQRLRHICDTPIIMLTARNSGEDIIKGLSLGADDYLTKPFSFSELLVRIQALLRRASMAASPVELSVGDLHINLLTRVVFRGKTQIELQPREFALLEFFMRNAGNVLTKTVILEHIWDYHFDPQTNVVDVLVSRLRGKIDRDFNIKLIHTVRGVGYVLKNRG